MGVKKGQHGSSVHGDAGRKTLHKQGEDRGEDTIYGMDSELAAQIIRHENRSPCVVRCSVEGLMAASGDCFPTAMKSQSKRAFREKHILFLGATTHGYRVFALVEVYAGNRNAPVIMDAITGTFYNATDGLCMTSENERIEYVRMVDDIKPYLKANPDYSHLSEQWGNERFGRNYG